MHTLYCWVASAPTANLSSSRLESVKKWTDEATQLRARAASGGARRVLLLRQSDLKTWAKHLRDAKPPNQRYTPTTLRTDNGVVRPSTPEQMRRAAAQEWQALFSQPSLPWSHPTVISPGLMRQGGFAEVLSPTDCHTTWRKSSWPRSPPGRGCGSIGWGVRFVSLRKMNLLSMVGSCGNLVCCGWHAALVLVMATHTLWCT